MSEPTGRNVIFFRPVSAVLRRIVDVRDDEIGALLWAGLYFFALLACNYVLRPVRETMGIREGIEKLPWLFTGTLLATLLASPLFSALVSRWPRRRFIPCVYRFFALNLLVFFALLRGPWLSEATRVRLGYAFYIWMSVFNLFVISVFWGFMADFFTSAQGKRLFGFIALGGTLGAIAGSWTVKTWARSIEPVGLLVVGALLLEVAVFCVSRLGRLDRRGRKAAPAAVDPELAQGGTWGGVVHTFTSPYLLGIAGYTLLHPLSATLMNFAQSQLVYSTFASRGEQTVFFGHVDLFVNTSTIVVQALLSGRVLRAVGVGPTAALLPLVSLLGFAALAAWPVIGVLFWAQVARRATEYSLARPAREVFYTVVSRGEKYKAKSFIDTFVYRSADTLGAWIYAPAAGLATGLTGVALIAAPLAVAWGTLGLILGRRQQQLAAGLPARVGPDYSE